MSGGGSPLPPVRVEKALEVMPELEALAPLRALLISIARPDERALWSSSGPYLTLGKRGVDPDELRRRLPQALHRIAEHVHVLCKTYVEALEARQRGDAAGVVAALVGGGRLEEDVGRLLQGRAWYELALSVAEALQDRRPEVESLRALGYLCLRLGQHGEGARQFQRAFALAEAEFDQAGTIAACEGLGDVALAQGEWAGAQAWYGRGLRLAEASGDDGQMGRLERRLGVLARKQGDLATAGDYLRRARERFEAAGPAGGMARGVGAPGPRDPQPGGENPPPPGDPAGPAPAPRAPPAPGPGGEGGRGGRRRRGVGGDVCWGAAGWGLVRGSRCPVVPRGAAPLRVCEVALVAVLGCVAAREDERAAGAFVFVVWWLPPPQAASPINPTAARMVLVMRASESGVVPI